MINKFSEVNIVYIKYNMYIKIDPKSIPKFI